MSVVCYQKLNFFPSPLQSNTGLADSKLSVSLQLLDLGQSVEPLGRVISSSQGLYLYTNTQKRTYKTNHKHPCCEWFEPTVPASARVKRVHVLDRSATATSKVILIMYICTYNFACSLCGWETDVSDVNGGTQTECV
jgi:hypothetical protein